MLEGDGDHVEQVSNAGAGVGNDGAAFVQLFLALHHDVSVGQGLAVIEGLSVFDCHVSRKAGFHGFLDGLFGCSR